MAREASFSFIPAALLGNNTKVGLTVSIGLKTHFLTFSLKATGVEDLVGRYVKFYIDTQKNTLAWKLFDKENSLQALGDYHLIKEEILKNKGQVHGRQIRVYLPANIFHVLKFNPDSKKHLKLDVKTYKSQGLLEVENNEYHYVTIEK